MEAYGKVNLKTTRRIQLESFILKMVKCKLFLIQKLLLIFLMDKVIMVF